MDEPTDSPPPKPAFSAWHLSVLAGLIVFLVLAGIGVWLIDRVTNPAVTRTITEEFREYVPTVGHADGILVTATSSVPETFTRSDSAWLFNVIPLGTTVAEIRVPAIYRYNIQLYDTWKLATRGEVCIVMAPQFRPSIPPAIVTDKMEKSTSGSWLRFDGEQNLDTLERDITEELDRRADDKTHRDYVREACRHSVAEFVKVWLMKEDYWRQDRYHQIVVLFPDEAQGGDLANRHDRPTITFEEQPGGAR